MRLRVYLVALLAIVVITSMVLLQALRNLPAKFYSQEQTELQISQNIGIPKIIHQIWHDYRIPVQTVKYLQSWMEHHPPPEWEYWFWTKSDWEYLIKTRFPNFYESFHGFHQEIFRADIIRHFIMYEIGGIYADIDVTSLRTIDGFILNKSCVLSHEPFEHSYFLYQKFDGLVSTAFLASRPRHPFFRKIVHEYQKISPHDEKSGKDFLDPVSVTGPVKFDMLYREYLDSNFTQEEDRIFLAEPKYFMPTYDSGRQSEIEVECEITKRKMINTTEVMRSLQLCRYLEKHSFKPPLPASAYSNHLWIHTYIGRRRLSLTNAKDMTSNITVQKILAKRFGIETV